MKRIRTQRALAMYDLDDVLIDASNPDVLICNNGTVPVLVIPEADVKGCKHEDGDYDGLSTGHGTLLLVCRNCGARQWNNKRWQLPRILRVARGKK